MKSQSKKRRTMLLVCFVPVASGTKATVYTAAGRAVCVIEGSDGFVALSLDAIGVDLPGRLALGGLELCADYGAQSVLSDDRDAGAAHVTASRE